MKIMTTFIILSAFIIMLASLVGKLLMFKGMGEFIEKNSQYLTTFASGVFIVLAFSLIKEVFHASQNYLIIFGSIFAGILIIELIVRLLPKAHHDHCIPPHCNKKHSTIDARRMMWTDAFHNIGDGILIVSAYIVSIEVGIAATLGIFLHEIVQEMSEFFVLKEAGYSTRKALIYNFAIASTIFIGIILALSLTSIDWMMIPLMGFAAGGFIYVLAKDLLPHMAYHANLKKTWAKHIIILLCGVIAMILINKIVPHSHEHHEHDEHDTTNYSHENT
jgi:zinc and cadmium transporter